MFSQRLTRFLRAPPPPSRSRAVPTASSARPPRTARARATTTTSLPAISAAARPAGDPTLGLGRPRGSSRHGRQRVHIQLHTHDLGGSEGDHRRDVLHEIPEGASSTSASAIRKGEGVLVLGTTNGATITASQVIVQPTGGSADSSASAVVPFQRGAPSASKQVGQIPATYSQGSGTIVGGTSEQGDGSRAGRLPGRHRRPSGEAEQRRVRGPQHRRQLAAPHLRQPGLQGRRRRLVLGAVLEISPTRQRGNDAATSTNRTQRRPDVIP